MNEENQVYLLKYEEGVLVSTLASLYHLCGQEIPIYPTTDPSDKSSIGAVVRECLFAIIKVLINLTHRFNRGCMIFLYFFHIINASKLNLNQLNAAIIYLFIRPSLIFKTIYIKCISIIFIMFIQLSVANRLAHKLAFWIVVCFFYYVCLNHFRKKNDLT